jgi:hypothetical protein
MDFQQREWKDEEEATMGSHAFYPLSTWGYVCFHGDGGGVGTDPLIDNTLQSDDCQFLFLHKHLHLVNEKPTPL